MKHAFLILTFILTGLSTYAQKTPFFMHHVINPYLYNPAFAGYDKHAVFYLIHREQWLGIDGAPSSTNLSFHTPGGQVNPISYGADLSSDRLGVMSNLNLRATFAYLVPLGIEKEHYLRFGLGIGAFSQSFDLSEVAIEDDVVLQQALNRKTSLDGRVGLQYHIEKFNLGIAFPSIFGIPSIGSTSASPTIAALDYFIGSMNYSFTLSELSGISFEPTVTYHVASNSSNQIKAFGLFKFKESFWVGGGYQQQDGMGAIVGFKAKNLKIGYAYGFGGNSLAESAMGTHEVQLALVIGKKQEIVKRKPRLSTTVNGERIPEEAIIAAEKAKKEKQKAKKKKAKKKSKQVPDRKRVNTGQPTSDNSSNTQKQTQTQDESYEELKFESMEKNDQGVTILKTQDAQQNDARTEQTIDKQSNANQTLSSETEDKKAAPVVEEESRIVKMTQSKQQMNPLELKVGKYIVVGTFSMEDNARKLMQRLSARGYKADIGYHSDKKFYYVHVLSSNDVEFLKKKLRELKNSTEYKSAWILSIVD